MIEIKTLRDPVIEAPRPPVDDLKAMKVSLRLIEQKLKDPHSKSADIQAKLNLVRAGLVKDFVISSPDRVRLALISASEAKPLMPRPELFLIPAETIMVLSEDEMLATYANMEDLGIAKLPYPTLDIGIPAGMLLRLKEKPSVTDFAGWQLKFRYINEKFSTGLLINPTRDSFDLEILLGEAAVKNAADLARVILIVLLATRNAIKTRSKDKMLSAGVSIAKKNCWRPIYTTTITVPRYLPDATTGEGAVVPGAPKRPHLRRGHKRNQKYGPKLQFVKLIWIEPVFINADEKFVSSRAAYNASLNITLDKAPSKPEQ